GCIKPSQKSIQDGSYKPLSRPIFMYVSEKALAKPQVKAYLDYVIANQATIAEASQIVPMTDAQLAKAKAALATVEGASGQTTTQ
ncbi:MAG: phosphate ABC transporter substrate-binding protein, partial [Solirubrobacteraceae bacterium]